MKKKNINHKKRNLNLTYIKLEVILLHLNKTFLLNATAYRF